MGRYVCGTCGMVYDDSVGNNGGKDVIGWDSLPEDWECPDCGAPKSGFSLQNVSKCRVWVCTMCNYKYDESKGIPSAGIGPGIRFEDLPDDWKCPMCGTRKNIFRVYREERFD